MRILICAVGSYGDVYPFVGLGRSLRLRGHEVIFIANAQFRAAVEAEQLAFVPVGEAAAYRAAIENPDLRDPRRGPKLVFETVMRFVPQACETIAGLYRPGETLLVGSTLAFPARIFQETHGAPLATVHLSPSIVRSTRDAICLPFATVPETVPRWIKAGVYRLIDRYLVDPLIAPGLNRYRSSLGLPPVRRILHDWLHSPDLVIGFYPERFAPPRDDWPPQTRLAGFPLYDAAAHEAVLPEVEAFLEAGPPPALFAPGTASTAAGDFFDVSLAACEAAGLRALLVTRYPAQIPSPLPDWALHAPYLPFSAVLLRVHAFVHHGGIGTLSQGLRAGVPQIIRPVAFDQQDNAYRARKLGVAEVIKAGDYVSERVGAALRRAVSTERKEKCHALAAEFAGTDGLSQAAEMIEALGK